MEEKELNTAMEESPATRASSSCDEELKNKDYTISHFYELPVMLILFLAPCLRSSVY
jgi:hypothetical protein